jgi:signal peptidase II
VASFFNLVHALNPGAAFSFCWRGRLAAVVFLAIAFAISAWLAWLLSGRCAKRKAFRKPHSGRRIGQRVDRATRGHVIDYIDFTRTAGTGPPSTSLTWPSGGATALVAQSFMSVRTRPPQRSPSDIGTIRKFAMHTAQDTNLKRTPPA